MTISFEPCSHRLSLVSGIYVIMQGDKLAATCNSLKLVHEWLDGVKYFDAHLVKICLSDIDGDFTSDDITHLLAGDMFSDESTNEYRAYQEWKELTGRHLQWLEFWFDEWDPRTHGADLAKRLKRYNEINAPVRG